MKINDACEVFDGYKNNDGYGYRNGELTHRGAWIKANGAISKGFEVDHKCKNRACLNVKHLRLLTHRDNLLAGDTIPARYARRTHCGRGHPFSGRNLIIRPDGTRRCRSCSCANQRRYYKGKKV